MITYFHPAQRGHTVRTRLFGGQLAPAIEIASRIDDLLRAAQAVTDDMIAPALIDANTLERVHDRDYLELLENGFAEWQALFPASEELRPSLHRNRHMNALPRNILGKAGYFITDAASVLASDSWPAILASASSAVAAARRVIDYGGAAYALCRPPGHHAYADAACGFCFVNNAALAAEAISHQGLRVSILDIDVHHGNGTQQIFYDRDDVQTVSVHCDPNDLFPFYAGHADERGRGPGEGCNVNLPVPLMAGDADYLAAIQRGIAAVNDFAPDMLVLALGLDSSELDPAQCMRVTTDGFRRFGETIGRLKYPTVIVQEGGYPSPVLAANFEGFLGNFRAASGF